jgi:hypothetical protein
MEDSTKSRNNSRLFMSDSDTIETVPQVCRACGSELDLHQPDPEMPERLLGTCGDCKTWYLLEGDLGCVEIAPWEMNPGKGRLPETTPVRSHSTHSRNGHF